MVYLQSSAIELNKKRARDNAPISQTMPPNEETSFCNWEGVENMYVAPPQSAHKQNQHCCCKRELPLPNMIHMSQKNFMHLIQCSPTSSAEPATNLGMLPA